MKYEYIGKHPINFRGETIKKGNKVDCEIKLSVTQFKEVKEIIIKEVETPQKSKTKNK